MVLPKKIKILDIVYDISYQENPADVDHTKRISVWGQIDYWERKIRIYTKNRTPESILHTIMHEIIHGIDQQLKLGMSEKTVGRFATGMMSVLQDNHLLAPITKRGK